MLQKIQELARTAVGQVSIEWVEPCSVARVLIADIEHHIASIADASRDGMLMVRCRNNFEAVRDLPIISILGFDPDRVGS